MVVTLTVTLDTETGRVETSAPMHNKLLCYGLLEAARQNIQEYVVPVIATPSTAERHQIDRHLSLART